MVNTFTKRRVEADSSTGSEVMAWSMSRRFVAVALGAAYFGLAGCGEPPSRQSSGMFGADTGFASRASPTYGSSQGVVGGVSPGGMQRGTDLFLGADGSGGLSGQAIVVPVDGEDVELSLLGASIDSAARVVLSDTLGLNYVIDSGVEGSITIQTTGSIPKDALLDLFEASLQANNAQLRRDGDVIRIVPGVSGNTTFQVAGQGGVTGSSIVVAPLQFVSATEMVKLLDPLTEQGLKVVVEPNRNLLLLSGTQTLMEAGLEALNLFDVDVLQGKSVAIVRLRSADPEDVVIELKRIFEAEEGGMLDGVVDFVPNPRLRSILVISSRSVYVDKAQRWIRELDQTAAGTSVYMDTYLLQNRSAAEVAPILDGLLFGNETGETVGEQEGEGTASATVAGGPDLRVAADDSRNALIVVGDADAHAQVVTLLANLDSAPRQVLIEATIAEVSLTDEMDIGTRWFFETGNWGVGNRALSAGQVVANPGGFSAVLNVGSADLALSALASVTDVRVISAPTLMVLDNKEGILQIGDQVPIALQSSASADTPNAPVLTQIDYRDTGIILRVKPRIGEGGRVLLDISQEVSDVSKTVSSDIESPTISQRKVQTTVALGDGQTLALGGLVQESDNAVQSGVPILSRAPVIGNLFGSRNSQRGRTELLILIRPRVVRNEFEAAEVTDDWRNRLSNSNSILGTGLGPATHTIRDYVN
jgi:general secretion pathway protein D